METGKIEDGQHKLEALRSEHRDLDQLIARFSEDHSVDELQIKRLKKRKLVLKDMISHLEHQLAPDSAP